MQNTIADPEGYKSVGLSEAYKLITPGLPVLVASRGRFYNLTPIAWNTPLDYEPVTKVLFVSDPTHQCALNIHRTQEFALCIPASADDPVIEQCGSVSCADVDKFIKFGIPWIAAQKIDVHIQNGCSAWIECHLIRVIKEGSVEIFLGESVAAFERT